MNRPKRNMNPVNLKYARQREAAGEDKDGFAIFPTPEAGWRAAMSQIFLDASRKLTLYHYIHKFAPPSENDTEGYLSFVEAVTLIDKDTSLNLLMPMDLWKIVDAQAHMEGYYKREV